MQAMIQHDILQWAIARAQIRIDVLSQKLSVSADKIEKWLNGEARPTFKQAQNLAEKLHIPFGYLFLSEPPDEQLPIPDFRTIKNEPTYHISPYLTELIFDLDRKQRWYREYRVDNGYEPLPFVGSASASTPAVTLAQAIKETTQWQNAFEKSRTKEDFIYEMSRSVEDIGIMVMRSTDHHLVEHYEAIAACYDRRLVDLEHLGDLEDVEIAFGMRAQRETKRELTESQKMWNEVIERVGGTIEDDEPERITFVHTEKKVGRNDPCPCGSGKKYKKCCMNK